MDSNSNKIFAFFDFLAQKKKKKAPLPTGIQYMKGLISIENLWKKSRNHSIVDYIPFIIRNKKWTDFNFIIQELTFGDKQNEYGLIVRFSIENKSKELIEMGLSKSKSDFLLVLDKALTYMDNTIITEFYEKAENSKQYFEFFKYLMKTISSSINAIRLRFLFEYFIMKKNHLKLFKYMLETYGSISIKIHLIQYMLEQDYGFYSKQEKLEIFNLLLIGVDKSSLEHIYKKLTFQHENIVLYQKLGEYIKSL